MNILTKFMGILAGALFIGWLVLTFLGLDSVERPATMSLMNAGEIGLAASLVLFLIRFICLRRQRKHASVSGWPTV